MKHICRKNAPHLSAAFCTLALLLFAASPARGAGVGPAVAIEGGADSTDGVCFAGGVSLGCSLKFDAIPIYWSLCTGALFIYTGAFPSVDAYFDMTLTGDYWIINKPIGKQWKWYMGAGGALSGGVGDGGYVAAGPRFVAGLNAFEKDGFSEVFMQAALQAMASYDGDMSCRVTIPLQAGMRLWY